MSKAYTRIQDIRHRAGSTFMSFALVAGMMATSFQAAAVGPDYREVPVEQRDAFKVCADPHNMPNSNKDGEGFENKIAELFADALGMELKYYFFPQRLGYIRNSLRKSHDGKTYACDVVMSVPEHFDQATTTIPYYRSQYVLAFLDSWEHSDKIENAEDMFELSEAEREGMMIGVSDGGPGNVWVVRNGLRSHSTSYRRMLGDARIGVGDVYLADMLEGKITHAIVWGPIAGYWESLEVPDAGVRFVPLYNDPDYPQLTFEYTFAMGVRHGDYHMRGELDELIDTYQDEINEIMESYGVPLLPH